MNNSYTVKHRQSLRFRRIPSVFTTPLNTVCLCDPAVGGTKQTVELSAKLKLISHCDPAVGGRSNLLVFQQNKNRRTALRIASSSSRLWREISSQGLKIRVIASDHAVRGRAAIYRFVSKRLFSARRGRFLRPAERGTRNDCVYLAWRSDTTDCFVVLPQKAGGLLARTENFKSVKIR